MSVVSRSILPPEISCPDAERLEEELQCPISYEVMTQPTRLFCGHVFDRMSLVNSMIPAIFQETMGRLSGRFLPAYSCPTCREAVVVVRPSSSDPILAKLREYQGSYPIRFAQIRPAQVQHFAGMDRRNTPFFQAHAESLLLETPITDFTQNSDGLELRVKNAIIPTLHAFGLRHRKPIFRTSDLPPPKRGIKIEIDVGEYILSVTWDADNRLRLDSVRPSTWEEYRAYVRQKSSWKQELLLYRKKFKPIEKGLLLAGAAGLIGMGVSRIGQLALDFFDSYQMNDGYRYGLCTLGAGILTLGGRKIQRYFGAAPFSIQSIPALGLMGISLLDIVGSTQILRKHSLMGAAIANLLCGAFTMSAPYILKAARWLVRSAL